MSKWFWLSYADDRGFRGGCYVDADACPPEVPIPAVEPGSEDFARAHMQSILLGINPGGEVRGFGPFPEETLPPMEMRNRLLTLKEFDLMKWGDE